MPYSFLYYPNDFYLRYLTKSMKGDVSPVVYIVIAVVIGIAILAILFMPGFNPFSTEASASLCKSKVISACGKYETFGNTDVFRDIPSTCVKALNYYNPQGFTSCVEKGDLASCNQLCEWIKGF